MTDTEDVADEVAAKLAKMSPQERAEAKAKAKVREGLGSSLTVRICHTGFLVPHCVVVRSVPGST
jgi:hypothetical protein